MEAYFLQIFTSTTVREKSQKTWHLYKHWLYKCYEVHKGDMEFKTQNNQKMKKTNKDKKSLFSNRIGRKCIFRWTRNEQNNDHTLLTHKIEFRNSFKVFWGYWWRINLISTESFYIFKVELTSAGFFCLLLNTFYFSKHSKRVSFLLWITVSDVTYLEITTFELLSSNYSNWFHSNYNVLLIMKKFQFKIRSKSYFIVKIRLFMA